MLVVGHIDMEKYSCVTTDIATDEVILTEERIAHIRQRHPGDYERYMQYIPEIVSNPDYIIEDDRPYTAMCLKCFFDREARTYIRLALRLVTPEDTAGFKNSIITFMKTNKKEYGRLLRNKKILYRLYREE